MTDRRRALTILVVALVLLPVVAVPAAAQPVSGTVTVANGTAHGDRVTVTPLTADFQRAGSAVNTTVRNTSFTARGVTDAPRYFVRVVHDQSAHYALVDNQSDVRMRLSAEASGRLVAENGSALPGVRLMLTSKHGPVVTSVETGENGTFSFGPLQPNRTYHLRYSIDGVPYNRTFQTDAGTAESTLRVVAREPTANRSTLAATGGTPASHVLQVMAPNNDSGRGSRPMVVETLQLRNTGERPFVGRVAFRLPAGAQASGAMYRGNQVPFQQDGRTVTVNASVPTGESARFGVAYVLNGTTLERDLRYRQDVAAVTFRGYELSAVNHSDNLVRGQAPVPLLRTNGSAAGETIRVDLPATTSSGSSNASGASGTTPTPAPGPAQSTPALLFGAFVGAVVVALGVDRFL
jgi:hypothetical protein